MKPRPPRISTARTMSMHRVATPTPDRILKIAQAFRLGASVQQIHDSCKY